MTMRYDFISDALTEDARDSGEIAYYQRITIDDVLGFDSGNGLIDFKITIHEEAIN